MALVNAIKSASRLAEASLTDELEKVLVQINQLEKTITEIEISLSDLSHTNTKKIHAGIVRGIKKLKQNNSSKDVFQYRRRLGHLIKSFISEITVYNSEELLIFPWETEYLDKEFITANFDNRSKQSRFKTIEEYIDSRYGKRKLMTWNRYYSVKFKSGDVRYVRPSRGSTLFKKIPFQKT